MTSFFTEQIHLGRGLFKDYELQPGTFDEFFEAEENIFLQKIIHYFEKYSLERFMPLHEKAFQLFRQRGITFNVYKEQCGQEKIFPFDLLPRPIVYDQWLTIQKGLAQRILALNAFLQDIYGEQKILKDKVLDRELVLSAKGYLPKLQGITPPGGVYIHVSGIDLIRDGSSFAVLEDNLKVPSGVSYVLENRRITKQLFPEIFAQVPVLGINDYPAQLKKALYALLPESYEDPLLVLLTPGPYNSAYYEHLYLAKRMGCPLVRNQELVVENGKVYLKTLSGLKRVHMIYRRTDDEYLDPTVFKPDSCLGVPGLIDAYRRGNVVLANALGNGVADDKAIYPFVPQIIRYFLGEDPILPQIETYSCADPSSREQILANLSSYVIKIVNQSGGNGILIGEQATRQQLKEMGERIKANPRDYIAQPLKQLSTCPTLHNGKICPRRIDFRPFIIYGQTPWVLPGGLTRVALLKDSYIVNSCQGGGSKDTWVLGPI